MLAVAAAPPTGPHNRCRQRSVRSRSGHLIERAVAALGRRQPAALRRDRSALDAVGVVDDHVHLAVLGRILWNLVYARRTHPAPRLGDLPRNVLLDADVVGSVVA